MSPVAALFVTRDSHYKKMPGVDCYDIDRDALTWPGGCPCVCHPPCRSWGALKAFAKPRDRERDDARWAVAMVRKYGGVLEHPKGSSLWADQGLPASGKFDEFGGMTITINQVWFGHQARKSTWLYIVGTAGYPPPLPPFPPGAAQRKPTHYIGRPRRLVGRPDLPGYMPECTHKAREATPPELAHWLIELARLCDNKETPIC
jgi:hypothetical protein